MTNPDWTKGKILWKTGDTDENLDQAWQRIFNEKFNHGDHIDFHDAKKYHFDLFEKGRVEVLAIDGSIEKIQLENSKKCIYCITMTIKLAKKLFVEFFRLCTKLRIISYH